MSGNRAGGAKAAATNKELYGEHFYRRVGRSGGLVGDHSKKGFANPSHYPKAVEAGRKGGTISRRNQRELTHGAE